MKKFTLIKTALFGIRKAHFSKLRAVLTDMKNSGYNSVVRKVDDTHPHITKIQRAFKNKQGKGFSFFGTDPDELKARFTGNKNYYKTAMNKEALTGFGGLEKAMANRTKKINDLLKSSKNYGSLSDNFSKIREMSSKQITQHRNILNHLIKTKGIDRLKGK